ncbi:Heterokaryon incompatibility protein 6, OR allele [Fusarium oxysporum f. sp. cubense race 1]|uniref:Heterokaryon incompatibility protein 6, OR allele n=1 Tax=Fusarium oxysporum f. sp. cubense (strain race 1) TaxID=1229664 RepID=N4UVD3_FUSC1|nr:Heterokaryon incompatibility protein 6, OR allele [Fusarium oxysporum f. sp. cubense race 1]
MDKSHSNDYHIAIVAPLPEDYETAKALLDEAEAEYHLISSGAVCSLGKAGFHNVVLVGKAEDMTNVCVFVKDTVDDLLEAFPSVRAGFLIGVDATAPEESLAKPGDIVVAFPQGFQPGQVQFDVKETIVSNHISTTFEMSDPPSSVKSVINDMQSPKGRQDWGQYLQHQSSRAELASIEDHQPLERNIDKANKVLRDEKILSITESLHEALWHLRKPDEDRMLWVDALCIDQTNIKERGHQVNRMGEIYKKADKVVVWLGYLSGNATKLKSAITILEAQVAELPGIHRKWPREDPRWKSQWKQVEASLVPSCHTGLVDGLQSFMEKPWFSRVWILQEVANAKRAVVTCNLGDIPGWIFGLLPSAMDVEVSKQCQAVLDIMPHSTTSPTSRNQNRNLCGLLYKFRGCQATDPRDRVYALLGMATDMQESGIRTDYAKEEQMVMQELYAYIVGEQWPAVNSPASSIQELQRKLPDISRDRLQQKLESTRRTDLLEQCLLRQGLVTKIGHQHLFYVMQHGSAFTNLFLDKSESPFQVSSDVGLQCLQRFPDVFEILLQRSDFVISHMPNFVAQAIEYRPQILERLIASSSNPEKLRVEAILHAIQRGLPTCRAFLDNCESPVKISQEMVKKAMFYKIISLAGATKTGEMLKQEAEQDVPEDTAIRAIEDGPEAFTALLNKRGTNFRVTQRIREVASGYMYAFEVLRVKRQSEVFPDSDLGSSDPEWSSLDLFDLEMGL